MAVAGIYGTQRRGARGNKVLVDDGKGIWCGPVRVPKVAYFNKENKNMAKMVNTIKCSGAWRNGVLDGNPVWISVADGIIRYTKERGPGTIFRKNTL